MFSHEKLHVYKKALDFVTKTVAWAGTWDKKHAFVDQLSRAGESIVLNLAEAARQRGAGNKLRIADYAIGSSLECAACLDIARIKRFLTPEESSEEKSRLCEITRMLIGLRKAWGESLNEEPGDYSLNQPKEFQRGSFHHERLDVYQTGLRFIEWFAAQKGTKELSNRLLRQIDEAATSMLLNIAEGNGRYAELDHRRFLQMADIAAVKAAVYLDLTVGRGLLGKPDAQAGKELLHKVGTIVAGF
jgi:four helix bundle protein